MNVLNVFGIGLVVSLMVACGAPLAAMNDGEADSRSASSMVFPSYTAADLNGTMVTIPRDLPSNDTLVVVAFKRLHQRAINDWLAASRPLFSDFPSLDYMELPVLARMNRVSRWYIDRGMRSGIRGSEKRARVVTLYLDKQSFRQGLEIPDENDIQLFLVGHDGEIRWRAGGEVSVTHLRTLREALEAGSAQASK